MLQHLLKDAPVISKSLQCIRALHTEAATKVGELEARVVANNAYVRAQFVANDAASEGAVEANDLMLKQRLHEQSLQFEKQLKTVEADLRAVCFGVGHTLREHTKAEVSPLKDNLTSAWLEQSRARVAAAAAPGATSWSGFDPQLPNGPSSS